MLFRYSLALSSASLILAGIALLFWQQDWQYSLPTPRPDGLRQIPVGQVLQLSASLQSAPDRPLFLHFFNPHCPCSRFNLPQLRQLAHQYQSRIRFVAILPGDIPGTSPGQTLAAFQNLALGIEAFTDTDGSLAAAAGVYSTPQAVLLDSQQRLLFRGNYNISRYCTLPQTEFARLALEAFVSGAQVLTFPSAATISYGCPLRKQKGTNAPRWH